MSTETWQEIMNTKKGISNISLCLKLQGGRGDKGNTEVASADSFQLTWDNLKGTNSSAGSCSLKQVFEGILR